MTALERIKEIEASLERLKTAGPDDVVCIVLKVDSHKPANAILYVGANMITDLLKAFQVMREIAILSYTCGEASHNATVAEEFIDESFEERMKK